MVYSLYIEARAAFTSYLLTTCFWVVSRKVVKKAIELTTMVS
jgi:hypothetical protein